MGVTTTLERVRTALEHAKIEAEHNRPPECAGELGIAYRQGVEACAAALLELLDVGDYDDPAPGDLLADARAFCRYHCAHGTEAQPGEQLACATCSLRAHTIDRFADAAEEAAREAKEETP